MNILVIYEPTGEYSYMTPVWMLLHSYAFDWTRSLYINIETPFERHIFEEYDSSELIIAVPDHCYIRNANDPFIFGIHMPTLLTYVTKSLDTSFFGIDDIKHVMMRISDIEDILQCEVSSMFRWV